MDATIACQRGPGTVSLDSTSLTFLYRRLWEG